MASAVRPTIAVVDDDPDFLDVLRALLEGEGYAVVTCSAWQDALATLRAAQPDLLILDVRMHGAPDWYVFDEVIADPALAGAPRIVCSALWPDTRWSDPGVALERYHPLPKPFDLDALVALVRRLLGDVRKSPPRA
jgi:CheY-like chemotaxis protein